MSRSFVIRMTVNSVNFDLGEGSCTKVIPRYWFTLE